MADGQRMGEATDEHSERVERWISSRREFVKGALIGGGGLTTGALLAACGGSGSSSSAAAAAGGSGLAPERGDKVVFVVHDNNPFFVPVRIGFQTFGKLMGWTTQFTGPPSQDIGQTVALQQDALTSGAKGVIFTRIDTHSFDANIMRAQKMGIQIILSNVASAGYQKLGVGFVGQDFIPAGIVSGLQAGKHAQQTTGRKSGLIVLSNFAPGNSAIDLRVQGMKQGVTQYNQAQGTSYTTTTLVTSSDQAPAISAFDAAYRAHSGDVVCFAAGAIDVQFAGIWAKSKGLTGKIALGGFDLIAPVLQQIKSGEVQWTIGQNPWAQGWIASALLAQQLYPGYPSFNYDTGAEVVDATNIDHVITREKPFE